MCSDTNFTIDMSNTHIEYVWTLDSREGFVDIFCSKEKSWHVNRYNFLLKLITILLKV